MNTPGRTETLVFTIFILGLLLPWLWFQINLSINVDIAFLTQSAVYALSGEKMSEAYYDTNPPLSILIYLPAAALVKYAGVPMIYATLLYSLSLVALSTLLTFQALKPFPSLSIFEKRVVLGAYIFTNTVAANLYLGEKDQFILLALFPFTLMQLAKTRNLPIAKLWFGITTLMAAVFLMVKPHFVLIPALMLAHRTLTQKRLSVIFDIDSLALMTAIGIYSVILAIFFNDFLTIILPDILHLYVGVKEDWVFSVFFLFAGFAGMVAILATLLTKKPNKFILFFLFLSCACMIPYVIQGKGFYYHAMPAVSFICCALSLLLSNWISNLPQSWIKEKYSQNLATYLPILAIAALQYATFFPEGKSPALTHQQYREMPLTKLVLKACENKPDCSFFFFNDMTEIIHQTAVYTNIPHASRFSSFWFLPVMIDADNPNLTPEQRENLGKKYSTLIAADFKKFKPQIIILGRFNLEKNEKTFDFLAFFSKHSRELAQEMSHYKHDEPITFSQQTYFPGTLVENKDVAYDILTRKD